MSFREEIKKTSSLSIHEISSITFFKNLPEELLEVIAKHSIVKSFPKGSPILVEGQDANFFAIVRSGQVDINSNNHLIQCLGVGEFLGWSWFTQPFVWQFSAETRTATTLLIVDAEMVRNKMEEKPDIGYPLLKRLLAVISMRLTEARNRGPL
jgi:CRP/FNR family cyclic AMP-dependent transcriptional regulator